MGKWSSRKFWLGIFYLSQATTLAAMIIWHLPADQVVSAMSGLAAFEATTGAGLFGVIWGNVQAGKVAAAASNGNGGDK